MVKHCNACFNAALYMRPRHMDVLRETAKGKSNRQIGETLCLAEKTVKNHLSQVYKLLAVGNRAEAIVFAFKHHMVEVDEI